MGMADVSIGPARSGSVSLASRRRSDLEESRRYRMGSAEVHWEMLGDRLPVRSGALASTPRLAAALTGANKDYDLLFLPQQDHERFRNDPYDTRRSWDHSVEHPMGHSPPSYRLAAPGRR